LPTNLSKIVRKELFIPGFQRTGAALQLRIGDGRRNECPGHAHRAARALQARTVRIDTREVRNRSVRALVKAMHTGRRSTLFHHLVGASLLANGDGSGIRSRASSLQRARAATKTMEDRADSRVRLTLSRFPVEFKPEIHTAQGIIGLAEPRLQGHA